MHANAKKSAKGSVLKNDLQDNDIPNLRYGPMPSFPDQKRFARYIVIISMMVLAYYYSNKDKEKLFAAVNESVSQKTVQRHCSTTLLDELKIYKDCVPFTCGRGVYDKIITQEEIDILSKLAQDGFAMSKPSGGAAILDLHSGAISHGQDFVDVYKISKQPFLTSQRVVSYRSVRNKIQHMIAAQFLVNPSSLHLTHPTFFSRLTSVPPKTVHDEYWHLHVDKETYPSFHYTALLYLSDYNTDFEGGRFAFVAEDNSTHVVEPARGRVLVFTSGAENTHYVEPVTRGARTALTVAFTCNARLAIADPAPQTDT